MTSKKEVWCLLSLYYDFNISLRRNLRPVFKKIKKIFVPWRVFDDGQDEKEN
jgi:hypothetical protein